MEISPEQYKSIAVTYVLSGGIIAAFLGPTSANYTVSVIGKKFVGSFACMALIGVLNQLVVGMVSFPTPPAFSKAEQLNHRPLSVIISSPLFILSCSIATIAHTVMVMVMSNCALSMQGDYSFTTTTIVMELHFFSMFAPGFFTGVLIAKHGALNVSIIGAITFGVSAVAFAIGTDVWNYYSGMILLGVAWNFSFSAGTVMLTSSYLVHYLSDICIF